MTRRLRLICTWFFLLFVLASCDKKQEAIDDLRDFSLTLKEDSRSFTSDDWESAVEEYQAIEEELSHYKYSDEQQREIGRLKGLCAGYFMKAGLQNLMKTIEDFTKQLGGMSEGFKESFFENEEE